MLTACKEVIKSESRRCGAWRRHTRIGIAIFVFAVEVSASSIPPFVCSQSAAGQSSITKSAKCAKCGKRVQREWKFCKYCGARLPEMGSNAEHNPHPKPAKPVSPIGSKDKPPIPQGKPVSPPVNEERIVVEFKGLGLIPEEARGNDAVTELQLNELIKTLGQYLDSPKDRAFTMLKPAARVTRSRVLAAFVKRMFMEDEISDVTAFPDVVKPRDYSQIPSGYARYIVRAIAADWWDPSKPVAPREDATWTFIAAVLEKMPLAKGPDSRNAATGGKPRREGSYTGLILVAGDLPTALNEGYLFIKDEDGNTVYPVKGVMPDAAVVHEKGMAGLAATLDEAMKGRRVGAKPLVVNAVKRLGSAFYVSNETAKQILAADADGLFLANLSVIVVK